LPKSRNRSNKAIKRQAFKQFRGIKMTQAQIIQALQSFNLLCQQHAGVINAQRDKMKLLDLRVQLLEEKVYAGLTQEERERLADIIEAASTPPVPEQPAPDAAPDSPVIEGEVVTDPAVIEDALKDTVPAAEEQPAA
jgi:hypothetical protein